MILVVRDIDYSENIKEKPKMEVQAHHFSGKQFSLHCMVYESSEKIFFYYQFSDEKTHDWKFTKTAIEEVIPKIFANNNIVVIKSDNCRVQYKCAYVFGMYRDLAKKTGKTFIVLYGASGHGRGLVDGMSSFGVKTPLRKEIITNDFYWNNACELVQLFNDIGMSSETKIYSELKKCDIINQEKPESYPIPGNTKRHMIVFNTDRTVLHKRDICDCDNCLIGKIDVCKYDENDKKTSNSDDDSDDDSEDLDDEDLDNELSMQVEMTIEIVREHRIGKVISLKAPAEVGESFYLVVVDAVKTAETNIFDAYNHHVQSGSTYFECYYLNIADKRSRYIKYKKLTTKVFVDPVHVLHPYVAISDDFVLDASEKQWLDDSV